MHKEGLEPSTYRLEGGCSIRLSYWCKQGVTAQVLRMTSLKRLGRHLQLAL